MPRLLITGGAGFLGSHTCLLLLQAGHRLVVLDSFANSSQGSLERVVQLAGGDARERLTLVEGDIRSRDDLEPAFQEDPQGEAISAVLHFAGLKAVAESIAEPLRYWDVNVGGSRLLLELMQEHGCRTLVFSSSATVYGMPEAVPIPETAPLRPINPYGQTKAAVEQLLADVCGSDVLGNDEQPSGSERHTPWRIARLRYFNPVGAHPSGQLGEDPQGTPSNLFPLASAPSSICMATTGPPPMARASATSSM
jgi:UDP-glucose 4-epimerase